MSRTPMRVVDRLLLSCTPTGRQYLRGVRTAEWQGMLATRRLEIAEILCDVGLYHLSLAELTSQQVRTASPRLSQRADEIIESLFSLTCAELDQFATYERSMW